jgi:chromosome segregation ATPase
LLKKIEEYQKINREWETKVYSIKNAMLNLEGEKEKLKEENEKLKDEYDALQFKLKLTYEREKIQEINLKSIKDLQNDYDIKTQEVKKEFKTKEESLKKKYEKLEKINESNLLSIEEEFNEKLEKLSLKLREHEKQNFSLVNQLDDYKFKLSQSENFFKQKEEEFDEIVVNKDRKLKELEICIKSISDEANSQINKLSLSVNEFNEKINYYKQREVEISEEYLHLKSQVDLGSNFCKNCKQSKLSKNCNKSLSFEEDQLSHSVRINKTPSIANDKKTSSEILVRFF